jgi:hypothetical protein
VTRPSPPWPTYHHVVFAVKPNGELEIQVARVGLQDYVSAKIISGLEPGDVVSLGMSGTGEISRGSPEAELGMPMPGIFVP